MKRAHFDLFGPVCPQCLRDRGEERPLAVARVEREEADAVIEGMLVCTNEACRSEFPIIDSIPVIVADLRAFLTNAALPLLLREDLSETTESLLGDCFGPDSAYGLGRHHVSAYAYDHYADLDPAPPAGPPPGAAVRMLMAGLDAVETGPPLPDGPILDLGCSVGRTSLALAERYARPVLGVDLHLGMLRLAQRVLGGRVRYDARRVGTVHDRRDYPVRLDGALVDYWAMDATALPLTGGRAALAASINLLDCTSSPRDHLAAVGRMLAPGGAAVVATPYDWATSATPVQAWLGGHSQRNDTQGASERFVRALLQEGVDGLRLAHEIEAVEWTVRLHARAAMHYASHLVAARKE